MEKIRACKTLLLYSLIAVLEFSVVFAVGFWRGYSHAGRSGGDSEGAERYEKRNASASESVGRIEGGLGELAGQMHEARRAVDESLTGIGELREDSIRIAGRSQSIEGTAGRIEDGICRIEQIIFKAEEENGVLADDYDCIDPGGGN